MLVLGGILTVLAVVACIFVILLGMSLSEFGQGVLVGILAPALAFFAIRWFYWSAITNAVEVTPAQFPEVYTIYHDLAQQMGFRPDAAGKGITRLPRLYIKNGNGVMNAYASKCQVSRGYVVIHSDLVDVGYTYQDWEFVRFVLRPRGREGHDPPVLRQAPEASGQHGRVFCEHARAQGWFLDQGGELPVRPRGWVPPDGRASRGGDEGLGRAWKNAVAPRFTTPTSRPIAKCILGFLPLYRT